MDGFDVPVEKERDPDHGKERFVKPKHPTSKVLKECRRAWGSFSRASPPIVPPELILQIALHRVIVPNASGEFFRTSPESTLLSDSRSSEFDLAARALQHQRPCSPVDPSHVESVGGGNTAVPVARIFDRAFLVPEVCEGWQLVFQPPGGSAAPGACGRKSIRQFQRQTQHPNDAQESRHWYEIACREI